AYGPRERIANVDGNRREKPREDRLPGGGNAVRQLPEGDIRGSAVSLRGWRVREFSFYRGDSAVDRERRWHAIGPSGRQGLVRTHAAQHNQAAARRSGSDASANRGYQEALHGTVR